MLPLPKKSRPCEATHRPGMMSQIQLQRHIAAQKRPPSRPPVPQRKAERASSTLNSQSSTSRPGEHRITFSLRIEAQEVRVSVGTNSSQASPMTLRFVRSKPPGLTLSNSIFDFTQFRRAKAPHGLSSPESSSLSGHLLRCAAANTGRANSAAAGGGCTSTGSGGSRAQSESRRQTDAGAVVPGQGMHQQGACVDLARDQQVSARSAGKDELRRLQHGAEGPQRVAQDCQVCT